MPRSIFSSMLPTESLGNIIGSICTLPPAGIVPTLNLVDPAVTSGITSIDCWTVAEETFSSLVVAGITLLLSAPFS